MNGSKVAVSPTMKYRPTMGVLTGEGTEDARKKAALILEVLAGVKRPSDASQVLGATLQAYYAWEAKALQAFVKALEPHGRGPRRRPDTVIAELAREKKRLEQELARKGSFIRMAERAMGFGPLGRPKPDLQKNGRRKRRPDVRAVRAVALLRKPAVVTETPSPGGPAAETKAGVKSS